MEIGTLSGEMAAAGRAKRSVAGSDLHANLPTRDMKKCDVVRCPESGAMARNKSDFTLF